MGKDSKVDWTHHTFSPWEGCEKVSPACKNCYAETRAIRWGYSVGGQHLPLWGPGSVRKFRSDAYWRQPLWWDRVAYELGERHRVFCMSLGDVFEQLPGGHPDRQRMIAERLRLFELIERTPNLRWLLLTKRPENIPAILGDAQFPNVWLGVTVENQAAADERIPHLLKVPARLRFMSMEPLLGPVDLKPWMNACVCPDCDTATVGWVIAGCESGPRARPTEDDWLRELRDQCVAAGTPFFLKQRMISGKLVKMPELDGKVWDGVPTP